MTNTKLLLSFLAAFVILSAFSTSVFAEIRTGVADQNASLLFNITFVNSSGYVIAPGQFAVPGSLALIVNVTPENSSSVYIRDNISFTSPNTTFSFALGMNTSNDTDVPSFQGRMNYTVRIWINDSSSTPNSYAKIDMYGVNLNYTRAATNPCDFICNGTINLQYVPMGYYPYILNSTGPAFRTVSILGGFALNMTNLTFSNISVALPRFGIMPEYIYRCDSYNYSTSAVLNTNKQMAYGCNAEGWGLQTSATSNNVSFNGSHILLNFTYLSTGGVGSRAVRINGTFFGEKRYNMQPLISSQNKSIVDVTIVSWANKRTKYFTYVPIFKFNTSNGRLYLASGGYAETMFMGTGVGSNEAGPMEEPNVTEMLVYNLTFRVNATPLAAGNPQFVNVSIKPRYINPGVISGNESVLIPVWNSSMNGFSPGSGNKTTTVIFPNMSQIVYQITWNGSSHICRWQTTSPPSPGGSPVAHYTNVSPLLTLGYPCNATSASFSAQTGEINISVASLTDALADEGAGDGAGNDGASRTGGNNTVSMLFMPATNDDPRTGAQAFSPVYIINQTVTGFGFTPDINSSAPKIGEGSVSTFFVQLNSTSRNITAINGSNMIVRFLFPLNVTIWQGAVGTSTANTSATLGSNIQLWIANDSRLQPSGIYNWTLLANQTHMLANATSVDATTGLLSITPNNTADAGLSKYYNTSAVAACVGYRCDNFINITQRNYSFVDSMPFSPTSGKNVTMWFMLFDVNLTALNGWLPISNPSVSTNITLNLTASIDFKLLTESDSATGAVGRNTYNSTVSLGQASEVDFADKLQGVASATGVTVYVDGQKSDQYRRGSLIVSFTSAGTHTVSFDYSVPGTTVGAVTPSSGGAAVTTVAGKVTKTITSIAAGGSQAYGASDLEGTKLTGLTIAVKNAVSSVTVTVEKLDAKPSDVSDLTVKKYQFIGVTSSIVTADIDKITFNFKIEKTWFTTNSVDKSKISLYRYADSKWNELTTTKANEDADYVYYTATSSGLSTFLIAESAAVGAVAAPTTTPTTPTTNVTTPTQPTTTPTKPTPEAAAPAVSTEVVIGIIVVIIILAVAVAWKKKIIKF